jgi:hypothetical protein
MLDHSDLQTQVRAVCGSACEYAMCYVRAQCWEVCLAVLFKRWKPRESKLERWEVMSDIFIDKENAGRVQYRPSATHNPARNV